ncbi:unnamed protein product [Peronospora effusa]|uniref:Uncharacterized protein n=1 Tax=Peronospora effusa TaxID=542832 RepID=A0A3M6VEM2_9STRA|nr:hypothetical protein DD238_007360 [Peronospora effusa]RQM08943.1 hypothetical protein DD237_006269 [Peronospora effusa]CAI5714401.1 unnamed protein product [Peronospora effusa]
MKDKTPIVRPNGNDSDSEEAPEVMTKQSATEIVQKQRRQEKEARARAMATKSRKRKNKQLTEVPELPDEVLSVVAARKEEEEEAAEKEETMAQLRAKKRRALNEAKLAKLMEKKTHTRQFGNIQVQTLEALEKTQTRTLLASAKEFMELRFAPTRERMNVMEGHASQFTKKRKG